MKNWITIDRSRWTGGRIHAWIGLIRADYTNWRWNDNSTWDYGINVSGGVYPWCPLEPNYIDSLQNSTQIVWGPFCWDDIPSNRETAFICNVCEGKLDKYMAYGDTARFTGESARR